NVLLIPSNEDGIGIYYIDDSMITEKGIEDSNSIEYINQWNKKVIKILLLPQINDKVLIIFEEGEENNLSYSFALESIEGILTQNNESDDDDDFYYDDDSWGGYDDGGDSEYCGACQESPCMCSDRERTSMTYDY